MNDSILTYDKLNMQSFKKNNPTNILNIHENDIFKNKEKVSDNIDKITPFDAVFNNFQSIPPVSNRVKTEKDIHKLNKKVMVKSDPNRVKYNDIYSQTPYATYMLTDIGGNSFNNVVSRFNDCNGVWSDGYYDNANTKWHDSKKEKCYYKNGKEKDPCIKYNKYYRILNPNFKGKKCTNEDGDILKNGDIKKVYCDDSCNNCKLKYSCNKIKTISGGKKSDKPSPTPTPTPTPTPAPTPTPTPTPSKTKKDENTDIKIYTDCKLGKDNAYTELQCNVKYKKGKIEKDKKIQKEDIICFDTKKNRDKYSKIYSNVCKWN